MSELKRIYIKADKRKNGIPCFSSVVFIGQQRIYLRRYDTEQEATDAANEFIRTGIKPEPKKRRETGAKYRKATVKAVRRANYQRTRWDVMGRIGHCKEAKKVHVGSFDSREEALAKGAIFEQTGQTFKAGQGKRLRTMTPKPKAEKPKPRETRQATVVNPPPRNPWAERYGRAA